MGVPEGTKQKAFFLSPDLIHRVQVAARMVKRTQSDVASEALEAYLGRLSREVKAPLKPAVKPRGRRREPSPSPAPAGR